MRGSPKPNLKLSDRWGPFVGETCLTELRSVYWVHPSFRTWLPWIRPDWMDKMKRHQEQFSQNTLFQLYAFPQVVFSLSCGCFSWVLPNCTIMLPRRIPTLCLTSRYPRSVTPASGSHSPSRVGHSSNVQEKKSALNALVSAPLAQWSCMKV
jgi:hypothetical protein